MPYTCEGCLDERWCAVFGGCARQARYVMERLQSDVFSGEEPGQRHARGAIQDCLNNMPGGVCWNGATPSQGTADGR